MRHKSLVFAIMSACFSTIIMAETTNPVSPGYTAESTDNLDPKADGVCESTPLCNNDNTCWDSKDTTNASFGYFSIGVGYTNLCGSFSNPEYTNTQPQYLGNPPLTYLSNPNYDEGMLLSTDSRKISSGSPLGSLEFGYNAALGQSKAYLGFFGGIKFLNAEPSIPVVLNDIDYESNFNTTTNQFEISDPTPAAIDYTSTIGNRLVLNAGVLFGYKISDRLFGFLKVGWSCLRMTSSKVTSKTTDSSPGYTPNYSNGLIYGGGIDFTLTERTSIGIEAFGTSYSNNIPLFVCQSNPGSETLNNETSGTLGTTPSNQKLIANPMAINTFGIMATFKINFLER